MKLYFVCHCVLNTCSKTRHSMDESYLAEEARRQQFLTRVLKNGDQLIQLPCPEFLQYGHCRWGHARSQFDNPFFREQCRQMLLPFVAQMQEYAAFPHEFHLEIVGIDGSPSCGVNSSFDGEGWGGESSVRCPAGSCHEKPGVFLSVLSQLLAERGLDIKITAL